VKSSLVIACGIMGICSHVAISQVLRFSLNLRENGMERPPKLYNSESEGSDTRHVAFDSRGLLYIGVPERNAAVSLRPNYGTGVYRVLGIAPDSGKIVRSLGFPMRSRFRVGINVNTSDKLLVSSNNQIRLIDEDGSAKSSFSLAVFDRYNGASWTVSSSPSGKTIMTSPDCCSDFTFLSGEDLKVIATCAGKAREDNPISFNDTTEVTTGGPDDHQVYSGPLCGKTQLSYPFNGIFVVPILLTDYRMLELGDSMLRLRSASGDILWKDDLPNHRRLILDYNTEAAALTRTNNRLAVMVAEWSGGISELDVSGKLKFRTIQIYDVGTGRLIASLPLKNSEPEFALNQDGTEVALLYQDSLEIWKF
jgi:hypothetical protein